MTPRRLDLFLAITVVLWPCMSAGAVAQPATCDQSAPPRLERAVPNDNRTPAGELRDGVLTLRLAAQRVAWQPDGPGGCRAEVYAFAEEGGAAHIPGPLIRVPVGTEVRVIIRSALPDTFWVRGLHDRTGTEIESVEVAPGETSEVRFHAATAGTFFYWTAFARRGPNWPPSSEHGSLLGGLIVDPTNGATDDRVFVITRWTNRRGSPDDGFESNAINGRSWPHTERLTLVQHQPVRWRVINATNDAHAMHLHGFYFVVTSRGGPVSDQLYDSERRELSVTEIMGPGRTVALQWTPETPGNWIFHCHLVRHMSVAQRLDRARRGGHDHPPPARGNHAIDGMAGLIVGVTVRPAGRGEAAATTAPRRIRLFANARPNVFGDRPGFGFVVQEDEREPAADSIRIPGTPLLLERGKPVAITIVNRLTHAISVHWHGIELESYFDGVADWSGVPGRTAPAIAPNDSFVARFAPPRAGTFIYHVHLEAQDDLASGLYGPLLVFAPGQPFDPEKDRVFVLSHPGPGSIRGNEKPPFVNGMNAPDSVELTSGQTYRFRFIGISANDLYTVRLLGGEKMVDWRPVARHGADLSPSQTAPVPANETLGPGTTLDVEFTPTATGQTVLEVDVVMANRGVPARTPTLVPIRVRP